MKAVILAGGLGTRLNEETQARPKPMVEVGGMPILLHIMKIYSSYGITDFVICLGYRGYMIKEYFANYFLHNSDITIDFSLPDSRLVHRSAAEPWKVTLVDTGANTMTGGRLKRVRSYLTPDEPFLMTYGDGVADVNVKALIDFHRAHGRQATLTAVEPAARFGALDLDGDTIRAFREKPAGSGYVNGGFFVLHPKVLDRIDGDQTSWEQEPLSSLAADGELRAFRHEGFWQPMDTLRDKNLLDSLWDSGKAPWKSWE